MDVGLSLYSDIFILTLNLLKYTEYLKLFENTYFHDEILFSLY